ncbi:hypothetical protein CEXT_461261 [Caerostris extrusa]|uniref:Reverse transcriptase Ty1/copia-type domain-containing protein n=1 Tax=Caerostris extrusa TaxID=172846 RepID=A0AAV4UAZ0_CAEEX|nr:hypothetical protein CEXT_461261 [Caerostris extrusa]
MDSDEFQIKQKLFFANVSFDQENPNRSIDKYRAKFMITFNPATKLRMVSSLISTAASEKKHLVQFDILTAFLYDNLDETIYMHQPEDYNVVMIVLCMQIQENFVCAHTSPQCCHRSLGKIYVRPWD